MDVAVLREQLIAKDWRLAAAAAKALSAAGEDGVRAVLEALNDPRPNLRRAAADWFDHFGDESCVLGLTERLLHDPVPKVRRAAVHSLSCDRCKTSPLVADRVPLLIQVIQTETNRMVRREAIYGFAWIPPEPRVVPVLHAVLAEPELHPELRDATHRMLRLHDPEYRRATDGVARAQSQATLSSASRSRSTRES